MDRDYTRKVSNCLCWDERETTDHEEECPVLQADPEPVQHRTVGMDPKVIPGSCDKLRSYWAGPYKIVRLMAPVLAEVIAVYEQGKPRIVSLDISRSLGGKTMYMAYPVTPHTLHFKGEMILQKFRAWT